MQGIEVGLTGLELAVGRLQFEPVGDAHFIQRSSIEERTESENQGILQGLCIRNCLLSIITIRSIVLSITITPSIVLSITTTPSIVISIITTPSIILSITTTHSIVLRSLFLFLFVFVFVFCFVFCFLFFDGIYLDLCAVLCNTEERGVNIIV